MLAGHEIESLRRSHVMAPLDPGQVTRLLETCAELDRRHREIVRILDDLPDSFGALRVALNELHRLAR